MRPAFADIGLVDLGTKSILASMWPHNTQDKDLPTTRGPCSYRLKVDSRRHRFQAHSYSKWQAYCSSGPNSMFLGTWFMVHSQTLWLAHWPTTDDPQGFSASSPPHPTPHWGTEWMPLCIAFYGSAGAQTQLFLLCVASTLASAPLPQPSFYLWIQEKFKKKKVTCANL